MNMTNPQHDLELIKSVIDESRKIIADNGLGFVIWGVLISIGMLINYIALVNNYPWNLNAVWLIIFAVAVTITVWGVIYDRRSHKAETLAGKFLGAIWIGFIVTLIINGFLGGMYPALAASILGMAYFPTGYATGFSMFRYLAVGWWIASVIMFIYAGLYTVLLFAILMILFQVIPGLMIYRRCRRDLLNVVPMTL